MGITRESNREDVSLFALGFRAESPKGAFLANSDMSIWALNEGSNFLTKPDRQNDETFINGAEGITKFVDSMLGGEGTFTKDHASAHHMLNALSLWAGAATKAAGTSGNSTLHTITPIVSNDHPSTSVWKRRGKGFGTERHALVLADTVKIAYNNSLAQVELGLVSGGLLERNFAKVEVIAAEDTTSLDISAFTAPRGATDGERLLNIALIRVKLVGETKFTTVTVTAATATTLTITAPGPTSGNVTFEIFYYTEETFADPSTLTTIIEPPLRWQDMVVGTNIDFDGSVVVDGGFELGCDLMEGFEFTCTNNIVVKPCADGAGTLDQKTARRAGPRKIEITLPERLVDPVRELMAYGNETFAMRVRLQSEDIPGGGGDKFFVDIIFPRCGFSETPDFETTDGEYQLSHKVEALVHPQFDMLFVKGGNEVTAGYLDAT